METEEYKNANINTIKEMILDEEKLVTYITLSKDLCMHVNNSKKLLTSAIETIREEEPNVQLNVSFIISGLSKDNTASTNVCTEKDLDKIRKSLTNVFFYHVYGACKGTSSIDPAAYLMLNKYEDFSLCTGMIKSKECYKRTSDEIGNLKTNSQETIVLENKPIISNKKLKQENKLFPEPASVSQVGNTQPIKQIEIKTETKVKTEVVSPKKQSNNYKQVIHKSNGVKTQKGITSFFNKPNGLQNKILPNETRHKDKIEKMDINNENSGFVANTKEEVIDEKVKKEPLKEEETVKKKEIVPEETDKILSKIKKSSKVDKKRKRVLQVSESESDVDNDPFIDNQEEINDSDDEIPPTPSANNQIKITLGITNPKKRRKMVDKTYTDDDRYILTKKEEVFESCSENENEDEVKLEKEIKVKSEVSPKAKKSSPKKTKKKISPIQKGNQPTLNNFFKKI